MQFFIYVCLFLYWSVPSVIEIRPCRSMGMLFYFRASVSEAGDEKREGPLKKYHVEKSFADRRYKVSSARTYFYLNEASCERNMDIFIRCLEAVAGNFIPISFGVINIVLLFKSFYFIPTRLH